MANRFHLLLTLLAVPMFSGEAAAQADRVAAREAQRNAAQQRQREHNMDRMIQRHQRGIETQRRNTEGALRAAQGDQARQARVEAQRAAQADRLRDSQERQRNSLPPNGWDSGLGTRR